MSKVASSAPTKENCPKNVEKCHWFSACWLLNCDEILYMEHDAIERKNVSRTERSDLTMKKSTWNRERILW